MGSSNGPQKATGGNERKSPNLFIPAVLWKISGGGGGGGGKKLQCGAGEAVEKSKSRRSSASFRSWERGEASQRRTLRGPFPGLSFRPSGGGRQARTNDPFSYCLAGSRFRLARPGPRPVRPDRRVPPAAPTRPQPHQQSRFGHLPIMWRRQRCSWSQAWHSPRW